jgi:RNA polymerase sigma-70 factor (ECF subfamily)
VALSQKTALSFEQSPQRRAHRDPTLIELIARGDEAAFNLFQNVTNGLLFGLLLRILDHTQTAESALSDLYGELKRQATRFGKKNEGPLAWLILIAHGCAIERLCCSKLASQMEILRDIGRKPKPTTVPGSFIKITEQRRLVRAALDTIPHLQRRVFELAFFSGMNRLEVARKLGQSPDEVESSLRYTILQLFGLFKSLRFSSGPKKDTRTPYRSTQHLGSSH